MDERLKLAARLLNASLRDFCLDPLKKRSGLPLGFLLVNRIHLRRGFVTNDEASADDTIFIQRDALLQREIGRLKAEVIRLHAEKDQHVAKIEHLEHDNAALLRLGDEAVAPVPAQAAEVTSAAPEAKAG